jgi:hypothetical protein
MAIPWQEHTSWQGLRQSTGIAIAWQCHGRIMPLDTSLPCSCHAIAMPLSCSLHALTVAIMLPSCLDASVRTQIHRIAETHLPAPDWRIGALLGVAACPWSTSLRHSKGCSVCVLFPLPFAMPLPCYCHALVRCLPCSCHVLAMVLP